MSKTSQSNGVQSFGIAVWYFYQSGLYLDKKERVEENMAPDVALKMTESF